MCALPGERHSPKQRLDLGAIARRPHDERRKMRAGSSRPPQGSQNERGHQLRVHMCPTALATPPEKIHTETGTVLVAYSDPHSEIKREALATGIYMYGSKVKFVLAGDRPVLIQCGRCHKLGHNRSSPACKLPRNAVRCHKCGGGHRSDRHGYECGTTHLVAGQCNCRPKCIMCGRI